MRKLAPLATALLVLAGLTTGCDIHVEGMADIPSATVVTGHGGMRGGAIIVDDDDDRVIVAPARRTPVIVAPSRREPAVPTAVSSDARNPVIQAFTANPGNQVVDGQPITFQVVAHDPGNQPLQYNWAATGGTLSTTTGQMVVWTPPAKPGTYTVSTMISNARGGATSGSQNLVVLADGSIKQAPPAVAAAPAAEPPAPPPQQAAAKPKAPVVEECDCDDEADADVAPAGELESFL